MQIFNIERWYNSQPPYKIDTKLKYSTVAKYNNRKNLKIISETKILVRIWYFISNPVTYILFGVKRY